MKTRTVRFVEIAMLLLVTLAVVTRPIPAQAQICEGGYERADRNLVISEANNGLSILSQMLELAYISANGVFSINQRIPLENEFIARRAAFDQFGDRLRRRASSQTNEFLGRVLDSGYLGLGGLTITGSSIAEAQANSRIAIDALNEAVNTAQLCAVSSWDRIQVTLSENDGQCAGGFHRRERQIVRRVELRLSEILDAMSSLGEQAAYDVTSVVQRQMMNFELEFLKEEIEILGNTPRRGASARTVHFIATLVDPGFLGVAQSTVQGASIEESQRNARELLEALQGARDLVRGCFRR